MKRADVVNVRGLFAGNARYRTGPARPGFVWGPPEVAQLMVDLETSARDFGEDDDIDEERFYLGVLTVSRLGGGAFALVDGQQRLTVIQMFLAFARDRVQDASDRNRLDRMLVRRSLIRPPEPRLRLSPEDHAWFAHFILPPGATTRLPPSAPLGSPRYLLLAARFLEHCFATYTQVDIRRIAIFLLDNTAFVRSVAETHASWAHTAAPPARPPMPGPVYASPGHFKIAAE
jgi:Protein of unknown function DUF262